MVDTTHPKQVLKFAFIFALTASALYALHSFGAAVKDINDIIPTDTWLFQIFQFISSLAGKTTLAIAAGIAQLVMAGFQTPLADMAGKWRLLIVAAVSLVATVLGGMVAGLSVIGALGSGAGLVALQVLASQIWKQFFTPTGNQTKSQVTA